MTIGKMPTALDKIATLVHSTDNKTDIILNTSIRTSCLETVFINISIARIPVILNANTIDKYITSKSGLIL